MSNLSAFKNRSIESDVLSQIRAVGGSLYLVESRYCYQDSAGTTPVTDGSPVGFVRDLTDSKNLTQSTTGFKPLFKQAENNLYHDRVDDKLTITVTASTNYRIITASDSGISDYVILSPTSGVLSIPAIDFSALALIEDSKVIGDLNIIKRYFATKIKSINHTSILRLRFSTAGAKTLEITPASGANAIFSWSGGIDQNNSFSATVSANDTVELKTVTPNLITYIDWGARSLYGQIPSLSANTALTYFYCFNNQLTGSIPSLSSNTALIVFEGYNNQLTGSIPSLTANTALTGFYCPINQLTGSIPSLSANTALIEFECYNNQLTGSIPSLLANTALTQFICFNNQLTGWLGGTVSATLGVFQAHNNVLTQSAVDGLLAAFVAANKTTGTRILNLDGTGNSAPSAAGLVDKATLVSRGWTVTTN